MSECVVAAAPTKCFTRPPNVGAIGCPLGGPRPPCQPPEGRTFFCLKHRYRIIPACARGRRPLFAIFNRNRCALRAANKAGEACHRPYIGWPREPLGWGCRYRSRRPHRQHRGDDVFQPMPRVTARGDPTESVGGRPQVGASDAWKAYRLDGNLAASLAHIMPTKTPGSAVRPVEKTRRGDGNIGASSTPWRL